MSRPENPLARYRTYSYHHFLIACDNTTTAQLLAESPRFSDVLRFAEPSSRTGNEMIETISGTVGGVQTTGNYAVIINTMVDADFIIESVRWSTIFTPKDSNEAGAGPEQFTAFAIEGTMEIREPQGIQFLNTLNEVFDDLQTDPSGIVFMLKTIFVGHNDNGSSETLYNISPFLFVLVDVTGYFDVTGAGYTLTVVGVESGVSQLPQIARVAQGMSLNVKGGKSLEYVMRGLQTRINKAYIDYTNKLKDDMNKQGLDIFSPGKKVAYVIELDDHYKNNSGYVVDDQEIWKQDGDSDDEVGVITLGEDVDILNAISTVMRKCSKVLKDEEGGENGQKKRYSYRIRSAMESGDAAKRKYSQLLTGRDIEYFYVYRVVRYEQVTSSFEAIQSGEGCSASNGNTMEFDYFFSGKNIDILEFDLKMQMGLAFLYTISTNNNMYRDGNDAQQGNFRNMETAPGTGQISSRRQASIRENTPILFSSNNRDVLIRNSKQSAAATNFQAQLARFAALESLEAKMTILGNPRLLANTTRLPFTVTADDVQEGDVLLNWDSQPGLVKVNIYFPTPIGSRNPVTAEDSLTVRDYREPFWFRGCYYVYSVEHIFENGEFKQVVDMMSLPVDPFFEATDDTEKTEVTTEVQPVVTGNGGTTGGGV